MAPSGSIPIRETRGSLGHQSVLTPTPSMVEFVSVKAEIDWFQEL